MKYKRGFREICGFNDTYLMLVGIPLAGMIVSIMLFNDAYESSDWPFLSVCIPISMVYTLCFWLSMRWSYYQVKLRYPEVRQIGTRIFWVMVLLVIFYLIINFTLDHLFLWLLPGHHGRPSHILEILSTFLLTGLVISIYEAMSFYLQLETTLAEKVALERRQVQSQLEGLRNQVNPHFLFNSLNTLTYLIPENSEKAVRFVQKLSKVYRYVLESRDSAAIPLAEELDYLNAYVYLLKERFGDNLQVHLADLSAHLQAPIVPLTLQLLFENAIKHNIISTEKPLKIEVFYENKHLVVRNNLQRKNQVMDSTGVGLDNIRERYRLLMQGEVGIIATQDYFTVLVPLFQ